VPPELAQIVGGLPFAASLAAAATARTVRAGRRRTALNEALHELRRPLQALALASPQTASREPSRIDLSLQMATAALERLDCEINGESLAAVRCRVEARPLLEAAVTRWKARAALSGGTLLLRWRAAEAVVIADHSEVAQALDNLVVNAIEHGGPRIVIEATLGVGWLRIAVIDSGRRSPSGPRRRRPVELGERLSGRRRHGHGLRVVRRAAAAHGGRFELRCSQSRTEAVLELPLIDGEVPR
jgi:signal transduction histidine kinase